MSAPDIQHISSLAEARPGRGAALDQWYSAYARLQSVREGRTKDGSPYIDVQVSDVTASLTGKIWSDNPRTLAAVRELGRGIAVKLLFDVREYRDVVQLTVKRIRPVGDEDGDYDPGLVFGPGRELVEALLCDTLVFDIETVPGVDLRNLPPTIAKAVARSAERSDGDENKVMSLSPWFGRIVSLAFGDGSGDAEHPVHVLVVVPTELEGDDELAKLPPFIHPVSEPELLRAFWHLAEHAELVVSYNGRGFDVPYIVTRSLVHQIPARVDLLGRGLRPHLDLYRVIGTRGGPSSLDVVCWALGLSSPKGDMDGSMVSQIYDKGELEALATYNAGDVEATRSVFRSARDKILRFRDDW